MPSEADLKTLGLLAQKEDNKNSTSSIKPEKKEEIKEEKKTEIK